MPPRVRLAQEADAEAMAAIYRPLVEATAISFETVAPGADAMACRLRETLTTHPWLVCEVGGQVAGYAYATKHRARAAYRWSVDASVYVDARSRRLGIGRGLYGSLLAVLAAQGYCTAFAGITLPNPASVALHESVGFRHLTVYRRVGHKLGRWHDVGWWQSVLNEPQEPPDEPLELGAILRRPEWAMLQGRGVPLAHVAAAPERGTPRSGRQ